MPDFFYLYCSLDGDDRKKWARDLLVGNRIYFRQRAQLNDPNELRPQLTFEGSEDDIRRFVTDQIFRRVPDLKPAERLKLQGELVHRYRRTPAWVQSVLHQILDRVGVLCLSDSPDIPLMWAHYAQGHRGICVEFDASVGPFIAAQPVVYTDEPPVINRLRDSTDAILRKSMLTKSTHWSYEREWRVLVRWEDRSRIERYLNEHDVPQPLTDFIRNQRGPGHYELPQGAIVSVIVGSNASEETYAFIDACVRDAGVRIEVKTAVLAPNGAVKITV